MKYPVPFQFQSGAVKRATPNINQRERIRFQFQSGAVKSVLRCASSSVISYFNSKVVRLKAAKGIKT